MVGALVESNRGGRMRRHIGGIGLWDLVIDGGGLVET